MATQLFQAPHGSPAWFHTIAEQARVENRPITEYVMLTPELAAELLRNNPDNRFIRKAKIAQLSADIRGGRWTFNGEPILISKEGYLNDGQHRSGAVVETNIAIPVMMTFGLDRGSRTTVDQGAARSASDYLSMDGVPNATVVASVGRLLLAYEYGDGKVLSKVSDISNGEIVARYKDDKPVATSATFAASMQRYAKRFVTPQIVGFCHAVLSRINPADAETYMRQVCVGENIKKSDPAFAVREGLFRERVTATEKVHLIFRGWNAFRQKRPLSLAKVSGNLPALI